MEALIEAQNSCEILQKSTNALHQHLMPTSRDFTGISQGMSGIKKMEFTGI